MTILLMKHCSECDRMTLHYRQATEHTPPDCVHSDGRIMAAFLSALEELSRREGKTFPQIMADWLQKDPLGTLNAVAKFTGREVNVSTTVESSIDVRGLPVTNEWLAEFAAQRDTERDKDTGPH